MTDGSNPDSSSLAREQQLDEILADLMRAIDSGESIDSTEWITDHPDFAAELKEFFAKNGRLEKLVRPLRQAAANVLHVRCPHCHNPIELLDQAPLSEISCPSCGSSFSLIGDNTLPHDPSTKSFGHFELLDRVGIGQFGSVWKARDTKLDRTVAIKIPRNGRMDSAQTEMFLRDARAAAQLKHPNIVSVHEVGRQDDTVYIVSDFVQGATLKGWTEAKRLTPREAAELCVKIAKALHHAHEAGVIHRDLKPGNIMMDTEGEPHIVDFGLAKRETGEITMTVEGQILGTPAYMSPEQARGEGFKADRRADVYSLGVILFELLTGELPFRGDKQMLLVQILKDDPPSPRKLNSSAPRDLETICLKCLAKEPAKRYECGRSLADDLERFSFGEPIQAHPVGRLERTARWCQRHPQVASLLTVTVLLLTAITGLATWGYFRELKFRGKLQNSYDELQDEQIVTAQLNIDVQQLEGRRGELNAAVGEARQELQAAQPEMYETYLKLARSAWREDNIPLANHYLDRCLERLRDQDWQDLKNLCYPAVVTFDGQRCAAISPDGKLLAAGGEKYEVLVWEIASGRLLHSLDGHDGKANAIAFSPDGEMLAAGSGREVILWKLANESVHGVLTGHSVFVTDMAFSPDGRWLASASYLRQTINRRSVDKGEVILWDVKTLQRKHSLPGGMRHVVFNHDGRYLATPGGEVWDMTAHVNGVPSVVMTIPDASWHCRPAFHPSKDQLAVANTWYPGVTLWDVQSKQLLQRLTTAVRANCLEYSPDGNRLAYAGQVGDESYRLKLFRTELWNLITDERERSNPWHSRAVLQVLFSPTAQRLATVDIENVKFWDVTPTHNPTEEILTDIVNMDVGRLDWPQWGGSPSRVNTPAGKDIPTSCDVGSFDRKTGEWNSDGANNIKWVARLGSQTYGNPVVANGRVFVGTNNGAGHIKRYPPTIDLGVLLCLEEATGKFLWQHSNEKLATGRVHDWPLQGVCSTPVVDGNRLWYVSNRGEVVCLDTEGFHDGEDDGPVTREMVKMFQVSIDQLLRDLLTTAFKENEVSLPARWSLRREAVNKRWSIAQYDQKRRRYDLFFDVQAMDHKLLVARFDSPDDRNKTTELFSVEWPLLADLGKPSMVSHFRQVFTDAEVPLPDAIDVQTTVEGREWSFTTNVRDANRDCRLQMNGGFVSGFMTIMDEKDEADVVWRFNMMEELGVSQHNMANCSMLTVDGVLFVCTSNGLDVSHINLPAPEAPSFMAMDRETGEVLWTDNSPGKNILHAQWGSPSYGVFDGQPQVMFPGGDGWVYSFDPQGDGQGGSKLLWRFDGNPKVTKWILGGRGTRNNIIAFPAIYDGLVYIVMGQDPEHGEGTGRIWCIDPTKRVDGSDVSAELAVDRNGKILPHQRLQAVATWSQVFQDEATFCEGLYDGLVSAPLRERFASAGVNLPDKVSVEQTKLAQGRIKGEWMLTVDELTRFRVRQRSPNQGPEYVTVELETGHRAIPNSNSSVVWHYSEFDQNDDQEIDFEEEFHRSLCIPAIKDNILYTADFSGLVHCLNAKTGEVYWTYDMLAACWGSPLLVDDKVFIGDEDGDVLVFRHTPDPRIAMKVVERNGRTEFVPLPNGRQYDLLNEFNMGNSIYMTPIVANNVLYIATRSHLFAIQKTHGPRRTVTDAD